MSHMKPEVTKKQKWVLVDGPMGIDIVPAELVNEGLIVEAIAWVERHGVIETLPDGIAMYCENSRATSIEVREGYGVRLSAPGYMDCTSWSIFETAAEAAEEARKIAICFDCGEDGEDCACPDKQPDMLHAVATADYHKRRMASGEEDTRAEEVAHLPRQETNKIILGMARALYVCAYADHVENNPELGLPAATCGQDWMDVAPPTPEYAVRQAWRLCGVFESLNGTNIYALSQMAWADMHGDDSGERPDEHDQEFGHYLAMQALGHGVSWFDDHVKFEIKFPHFEFMLEDI